MIALDGPKGRCIGLFSASLTEHLHAVARTMPGSALVTGGVIVSHADGMQIAGMFPLAVCSQCARGSGCVLAMRRAQALAVHGFRPSGGVVAHVLQGVAQMPFVRDVVGSVFGFSARDAGAMVDAAAQMFGRAQRSTQGPAPRASRPPKPPRAPRPEPEREVYVHARVLGVAWPCTASEVREAFRFRIAKAHPDHGGSNTSTQRLVEARNALLKELGK